MTFQTDQRRGHSTINQYSIGIGLQKMSRNYYQPIGQLGSIAADSNIQCAYAFSAFPYIVAFLSLDSTRFVGAST